jgi:hypothetical protein
MPDSGRSLTTDLPNLTQSRWLRTIGRITTNRRHLYDNSQCVGADASKSKGTPAERCLRIYLIVPTR